MTDRSPILVTDRSLVKFLLLLFYGNIIFVKICLVVFSIMTGDHKSVLQKRAACTKYDFWVRDDLIGFIPLSELMTQEMA